MLNFSNKELVQKHLVQGISRNCNPGIGINILSINQFKVLKCVCFESLAEKNLLSKDMADKIPIWLQLSEIIQ